MRKELDMIDMNTLNAMASSLRHKGFYSFAETLNIIQGKATRMIEERKEATLVKTVRVTNPRNALIQIPSFIVGAWGLKLDDRVEVLYNEHTKEITLRPHV